MINPSSITNYNLNNHQLEEHILFWLLVAGKTAKVIARNLDRLLGFLCEEYGNYSPFVVLKMYDKKHPGELEDLLKSFGFGCHRMKAKGIRQLIYNNFDLKTCTVEQLESIYSIGCKTARCFLLHTRRNVRHAGLDTHVLKWLASLGYKVPKSTPTGKMYQKLEKIFLELADNLGKSPSVLDLEIWNQYSKK